MKTNILVVEDESIVAKDIAQSLKKLGYSVAGICSSGEDAITTAKEIKPDLILMDIMLKGEMNGIEAAEQISKNNKIPIIYLTAYADEATLARAKITEPNGYMIKPFEEADIQASIEMAVYKHGKDSEVRKERDLLFSLVENKGQTDVIYVKSNSRLVKVKTSDVFYVEALKDYVVINTKNARYTVHSTMKDIVKRLPSSDFVRVHRSFIVGTGKIVAVEYPNLILEEDKKTIPIGGSYREELYSRLHLVS